eukprot:scaffold62529_cov30-Tisochrysis_lutea.AAC.3
MDRQDGPTVTRTCEYPIYLVRGPHSAIFDHGRKGPTRAVGQVEGGRWCSPGVPVSGPRERI